MIKNLWIIELLGCRGAGVQAFPCIVNYRAKSYLNVKQLIKEFTHRVLVNNIAFCLIWKVNMSGVVLWQK